MACPLKRDTNWAKGRGLRKRPIFRNFGSQLLEAQNVLTNTTPLCSPHARLLWSGIKCWRKVCFRSKIRVYLPPPLINDVSTFPCHFAARARSGMTRIVYCEAFKTQSESSSSFASPGVKSTRTQYKGLFGSTKITEGALNNTTYAPNYVHRLCSLQLMSRACNGGHTS